MQARPTSLLALLVFWMVRQLPAFAAICALHLITVAAVDGLIASGQKRHLRLITTASTGDTIHLARLALARSSAKATPAAVTATASLLTRGATGRTARRGICQPSTSKKLLLTCGECELLITVATVQNLIHVCHMTFSFPGLKPVRYTLLFRFSLERSTLCSARSASDLSTLSTRHHTTLAYYNTFQEKIYA